MKLADQISYHLARFVRQNPYDIIIPNYYHRSYEMDLFKLTKSGQLYEYEIKISRADFFGDTKKKRTFHDQTKHDDIKLGKHVNRFYYVVPNGLITAEECPEFAGLMYYSDGAIRIVKDAPRFKYVHNMDYRELAVSLALREGVYKNKYRYEKAMRARAKAMIEDLRKKYPEDVNLMLRASTL